MKDRRSFVKVAYGAMAFSAAPINLFAQDENILADKTLSKDEIYNILNSVSKHLFPIITQLNIDVLSYLKIIISHSKVSIGAKNFIVNGVIWLNDVSIKQYESDYLSLSDKKQNDLLEIVSKDEEWGESWIYDMLVFCSEAVFSDPIYGANTDGNGWKWISHETGLPQPKTPFL
ncbi:MULTISPECIES: gluconate 2-dehydrogenase subunit 3 family protein [Campylobacter]|uniref:gluconate 2-dehydrogenase subunit 3 family protein n=1 Tax=Campylobacter TaxID=194 RepID=UPI00138DE9E0|nr:MULTISPECIES: gluconate 2-dehydrogenase subunit 3 family protein [Campylobacter]MDV2489840.1 gluconate 2-dehydrogenase subunit 3 family protein [Campylobacter sp. TJR-1]